MKSAADRLETETFTAEREWVVEGIPVLTARIALPEPVGPVDPPVGPTEPTPTDPTTPTEPEEGEKQDE